MNSISINDMIDIDQISNENFQNYIYKFNKKRNYNQMLYQYNLNNEYVNEKNFFTKKMKTTNHIGEEVKLYDNIIIKNELPENIKMEIEKYNQEKNNICTIPKNYCRCSKYVFDFY